MTDKHDPIAHAARLLREAAEELRQAHTLSSDRNNWIGEPEAKAAYDEHKAAAQALEDWEAAVGAGGLQALSAAPAGFVPVSAFDRLHAHAESLAARLLAASPTPPAEQQAITPETGNSVSAQGAAITSEFGAVYAELPADRYSKSGNVTDTGWYNIHDMRDFADRTHALRMEQATLKAAPGEPDPADIIAGALQISRGHAIEMMREALEAAPQQEAQEPSRAAKTWCSYVAGMIGCYLNEPDESTKVQAIAGIIERRLWALPTPQPAPLSEREDAALLHYALAIGGNQRMNWRDIWDDSSGEGEFIDALRKAKASDDRAALAAQGSKA